MLEEIFQDCFDKTDKFSVKLKYGLLLQILPVVSPKKLYPRIRLYQYADKHNLPLIRAYFRYRIDKRYRCEFSSNAQIGKGLITPHPCGIIVGKNSVIGEHVTIYQNVTLGQNKGQYPQIGNNVIIYANSCVIGDVKIGDGAIIGANSLVNKDIPANTIACGVPAKVIKIIDQGGFY